MVRRITDLAVAAIVAFGLIALVRLLPNDMPKEISGPAFVIDGDSIEILGSTIRLSGIDAPEGRQHCTRDGESWNCGNAAASALDRKIDGARVTCRPEGLDKYERYLAECFVSGESLNRWMVAHGWAVSYGSYAAEERAASEAGSGLWSSSFERPADWRKRHGR